MTRGYLWKNTGILLISLLLVFSMFGLALAREEVKDPETFTYVNRGNNDTLDPHFAYDTASSELIYQVYECLIEYDGSSVTDFKPLLAAEVPSSDNGLISDDGTTYTFPLREDVTFSNGEPMTPEDVKYSILRGLIQDRSGGPMWLLYEPLFGVSSLSALTEEVVGVENPGDLTAEQSAEVYAELEKKVEIEDNSIKFHLDKPYPPFLNIMVQDANLSSVLSKDWTIDQGGWDGSPETIAEYYDPTKEDDPLYDKMMGTGPFELDDWVNGDHAIFVRNENYWREPANFEQVTIEYIDEFSTRKLMLQRGDADMIRVPSQYIEQVKDMDNVTVTEGIPSIENVVGVMNWEIVTEGNKNIGSGKLDGEGIPAKFFADEHVRKGFVNAFNYQAYIQEVRKGRARQLNGPIVKPLLGQSDDQPVYSQDLDKAEEHFKQAFDGEVWEKGFEITILYNSGDDVRKTACDILETYVEQINPKFTVDVRGVQWSTYLDDLIAGKFTLGFIGWVGDYPDPHNFVVPYMSSDGTFGAYKGEAYQEWTRENADPLIKEGINTVDQEEREQIYSKLQQLAFENANDLWLDQRTLHNVRRDWVKGWYSNPMRPGEDFYSLDK
ncbi:MAG: ABC transporter substrate-binding protein [Bacillota bacterium]